MATGNITEVFGSRVDTLHTQLARDLYKTALYIKKDTLWDNQIEQIDVNTKNDMVLIPRVGDETIILGNADSLDVKMKNLKVFYHRALPQVIARRYKTINIKYSNQIVCERRDTLELARKAKTISAVDSLRLHQKVSDSLVNDVIGDIISERTEATESPKPEPKKVEAKKPEIKKTVTPKPEDKKAATVTKPKVAKPDDKKEKTTTVSKPKKTEAELKLSREREIRSLEKQYKTQQN